MSPRVYRPLAALLMGLLFGGLFVWFTKERGDDVPRGFALIHAHCVERSAETQRQVGATDSGTIRFAVSRQCTASPATYAREFRAFTHCVERRLGQSKAVPARDPRRISAETRCGHTTRPHGQGDLWDDMFLGAVHTTPSGRPIPLCPPLPDESRPADPPDWYPCNWWPRGS